MKVKSGMEWATAIIGFAATVTTLLTDRRTHISHGEHLPCKCRGTCLSCLRD